MKKWKQEERGKGEGRKEVCRREERNKGICLNIGRLTNTVGGKVRKCIYVHEVSKKRHTNRKKEGGEKSKERTEKVYKMESRENIRN
jgi:hypothetical protein